MRTRYSASVEKVIDQLFGPSDPYVKPEKKTPKFELTIWDLQQIHTEAYESYQRAKRVAESTALAASDAYKVKASAEAHLRELEERIYDYETENNIETRTILQVFRPESDETEEGT